MDFVDADDVDLVGVMNTVAVVDPAPARTVRLDHRHRVHGRDDARQRRTTR